MLNLEFVDGRIDGRKTRQTPNEGTMLFVFVAISSALVAPHGRTAGPGACAAALVTRDSGRQAPLALVARAAGRPALRSAGRGIACVADDKADAKFNLNSAVEQRWAFLANRDWRAGVPEIDRERAADLADTMQARKDKKLATNDTKRWCADRCLATGYCDAVEDIMQMTTKQVRRVISPNIHPRPAASTHSQELPALSALAQHTTHAHSGHDEKRSTETFAAEGQRAQ